MADYNYIPGSNGNIERTDEEIGNGEPREFVIEVDIPPESRGQEQILFDVLSSILETGEPTNQIDQPVFVAREFPGGDRGPIIVVDPQGGRTIWMRQGDQLDQNIEGEQEMGTVEGRIPVQVVRPHGLDQKPHFATRDGVPLAYSRHQEEQNEMDTGDLQRALDEIQVMAKQSLQHRGRRDETKEESERGQPEERKGGQPRSFLQRVGDYPLVNLAYSSYDSIKNSNFLMRAGLNTAEKVLSYTTPGMILEIIIWFTSTFFYCQSSHFLLAHISAFHLIICQ